MYINTTVILICGIITKHLSLGLLWCACVMQGRPREAQSDFSHAIALAPEAPVPYLNRAIALEELGLQLQERQQPEQALSMCEHAPTPSSQQPSPCHHHAPHLVTPCCAACTVCAYITRDSIVPTSHGTPICPHHTGHHCAHITWDSIVPTSHGTPLCLHHTGHHCAWSWQQALDILVAL